MSAQLSSVARSSGCELVRILQRKCQHPNESVADKERQGNKVSQAILDRSSRVRLEPDRLVDRGNNLGLSR